MQRRKFIALGAAAAVAPALPPILEVVVFDAAEVSAASATMAEPGLTILTEWSVYWWSKEGLMRVEPSGETRAL